MSRPKQKGVMAMARMEIMNKMLSAFKFSAVAGIVAWLALVSFMITMIDKDTATQS